MHSPISRAVRTACAALLVATLTMGCSPSMDADVRNPADAPGSSNDAATDTPSQPDIPPVPSDSGPLTNLTFQQGVDGYSGSHSVGISTYSGLGEPGQWNGNGATFADGDNDWCTGTDIPPSPYAEVWLLRFGDLNVPNSARVVEATLSIHGYGNDTATQLFLQGSFLAVPWNLETPLACAGCSNANVGWRYRDGNSNPWAALGAAGVGTDLISGSEFRIPERGFFATGSTPQEYQTRLDPAMVQRWIMGNNFGLRIVAGVGGVHMGYIQPQRAVTAMRPATMRPRLTLRVAMP